MDRVQGVGPHGARRRVGRVTMPTTGKGVHPSGCAAHATEERQAPDRRRAFATMMTRSKDNVGESLRTVPFAKALEIQAEVDKLVKFHLDDPSGDSKSRISITSP
ncbi:unnamed protein product [Ectocarpus fasciculatus]